MREVGARGGGLDYWDKKIDYPVSCRAVAQAEKLVTQEPECHRGDVLWFNFLFLKRISWWAIKIWASLLDSHFPFGLFSVFHVSVFCYNERHFCTHALLITDIGRFCWMSMCRFFKRVSLAALVRHSWHCWHCWHSLPKAYSLHFSLYLSFSLSFLSCFALPNFLCLSRRCTPLLFRTVFIRGVLVWGW